MPKVVRRAMKPNTGGTSVLPKNALAICRPITAWLRSAPKRAGVACI